MMNLLATLLKLEDNEIYLRVNTKKNIILTQNVWVVLIIKKI